MHLVKIHGRRGVKIRGLWYDGAGAGPLPVGPLAPGGAARGKWKIRREPRDRRHVFFCDPRTHDWHTLRWTGLPPEGEVPAFSDLRADDLLRAARAAGLRPRSDAELLPLLLDLVGGLIPVDAWPTQMSQAAAHRARPGGRPGRPGRRRPPRSRGAGRRAGSGRDRRRGSRGGADAVAGPGPRCRHRSGCRAAAPP